MVVLRPVSDLVDYSSCRRLFLFPEREFFVRRLRSSFNRTALLIRLTDLVDQLEFRAARGAKAEAEGKSYSRFKYRRFIQRQRTSRSGAPDAKVLYATASPNIAPVACEPPRRSLSSYGSSARR